jgi:hypothetical protein
MTTKVTIEVPETAQYMVEVRVETVYNDGTAPFYRVNDERVYPGERTEIFIYSGKRITEIAEKPLR